MTEHRWTYIQAERPGEISLTCRCGLVWKHLPLKRGQGAALPLCPAQTESQDWRDDPANAWCKVCDRGAEGCLHRQPTVQDHTNGSQ